MPRRPSWCAWPPAERRALVFDGVDVGKSDDVHAMARFDRIAAQIDATAGSHIVAAKVCSGALEDVGRVRLRVTDAKHAPLRVEASGDLAPKAGEAIAWGTAKTTKLTTPLLRALTGKGAPDALLAAAIVRSFGGADDQRARARPVSSTRSSSRRTSMPIASRWRRG